MRMNLIIQLTTSPNNDIYEVTILHLIKPNKYIIKLTAISRVNMYGNESKYIIEERHHLRKYCYCYDQ